MISYFGGKNKMSEWIYQYVPKNIKTLVEPFSGAMWTYMNPNVDYTHVDTIVYNDINKHMANLYACMREPEFLKRLEHELSDGFLHHDFTEKDDIREFYKSIYYKEKHDTSDGNFLDNPPTEFPDFDAGVKYAFLITSAFNACYPRSAGCSPIGSNNKPKVTALVNKLKNPKYQKKLKNITNVHNWDFEKIIKHYDSEDTYFYLDPPYEDADNKRLDWYGVGDNNMFGRDSHERLCKLLTQTKAKWSLSYYYFEELEEWLPRDKYTWIEKDFFRSSASFSDSGQVAGTELLILNYDVSDIEIKEIKKNKKTSMPRKNKKDVINDVIERIKLELKEDVLSNIRDMLNGLTVPKLEKYIDSTKEYLEDEIEKYNKVEAVVMNEEQKVVQENVEDEQKVVQENVKDIPKVDEKVVEEAVENLKEQEAETDFFDDVKEDVVGESSKDDGDDFFESGDVTDQTIEALKAKEEGKVYVFKEEEDVIEKQIAEKEKANEPKVIDNNTISVAPESDSFFEDTDDEEPVAEVKEEPKEEIEDNFFDTENESGDESGLLEASGLDKLKEIETVVEKKPVVEVDTDDDFWSS